MPGLRGKGHSDSVFQNLMGCAPAPHTAHCHHAQSQVGAKDSVMQEKAREPYGGCALCKPLCQVQADLRPGLPNPQSKWSFC